MARRWIPVVVATLTLLGACSDDAGPVEAGDDIEDVGTADFPFERHSEPSPALPEGAPAPEGVDGVVAVDIDGVQHVRDAVDYDAYPPLGGDHFDGWQNCGFYTQPVLDETAVHSLEHGAVWIAYRPDLDPAEIATLRSMVADADHLLITPYPDLRSPLVLTAWGRQGDAESVDDAIVAAFVETYVSADTAPEPGVTCAGAIGIPAAAAGQATGDEMAEDAES